MAQSNVVTNFGHGRERVLYAETILNAEIVLEEDLSPNQAGCYLSGSETRLGAGYSVRFKDGDKNWYLDGIKCEVFTGLSRVDIAACEVPTPFQILGTYPEVEPMISAVFDLPSWNRVREERSAQPGRTRRVSTEGIASGMTSFGIENSINRFECDIVDRTLGRGCYALSMF